MESADQQSEVSYTLGGEPGDSRAIVAAMARVLVSSWRRRQGSQQGSLDEDGDCAKCHEPNLADAEQDREAR